MNQNPYSFKEIGSGSVLTTNLPLITTATTTPLISAPSTKLIIYQIDWDLTGTNATLCIGDNNAVMGTDNIVQYISSNGHGTIVFPSGWESALAKALQCVSTGSGINAWLRITYQIA